MMAENEIELEILASKTDLLSVFDMLKTFDSQKNISLERINLAKSKMEIEYTKYVYLDSLNEDIIKEYLIGDDIYKIVMIIDGPYGDFYSFDDLKFFEKIAEAAPGATMKGRMHGTSGGEDQSVIGTLENGILTTKVIYPFMFEESEDEEIEEDVEIEYDAINRYDPVNKVYIDVIETSDNMTTLGEYLKAIMNSKIGYDRKIEKAVIAVKQVLPYKVFIERVGLDSPKFSEEDYDELLYNFDQFGGGYKTFCEFCGKKVLSEKQFIVLYEDLMSTKYDHEVS